PPPLPTRRSSDLLPTHRRYRAHRHLRCGGKLSDLAMTLDLRGTPTPLFHRHLLRTLGSYRELLIHRDRKRSGWFPSFQKPQVLNKTLVTLTVPVVEVSWSQ